MRSPDSVYIEVTNRCNQNCSHCFASANEKIKNELSLKEIYSIIDQVVSMGIFNIHITGGEPLLRKDLDQILNYLKNHCPNQFISLFSNGTLWSTPKTSRYLETISEMEAASIQFSFDSYIAQEYIDFRNGTSKDFTLLCEAIQMVKQNKINIGLVCTVTELNIDNALKTAKFALTELEVDSFLFIPVFYTGRALSNKKKLEFDYQKWARFVHDASIIKKYNKWEENTSKFTIGFMNFYDLFLPLKTYNCIDFAEKVWNFPTNPESFLFQSNHPFCQAGKTEICIAADGYVYPCVPARGTNFSAGNIRKRLLSEIWTHSDLLNWFRSFDPNVLIGTCSVCEHLSSCCGGCRLTAYIDSGIINASDPVCPLV